jgi:hypothetical protein
MASPSTAVGGGSGELVVSSQLCLALPAAAFVVLSACLVPRFKANLLFFGGNLFSLASQPSSSSPVLDFSCSGRLRFPLPGCDEDGFNTASKSKRKTSNLYQ